MVDRLELIELMKREAAISYPREACGLVIAVGKRHEAVVCRNASLVDDQFVIHHEDYLAAVERGELIGVWHTHPNLTQKPSQADLAGVESTGVPWFIIGVSKPAGEFKFTEMSVTEPSGFVMPYTERPYVSGAFDCYSLMRDYYRNEFSIEIGDYPRIESDGSQGSLMFVSRIEAEGFVRVSGEPEHGDVFLIQTTGRLPTHMAIYIGDDQILHHCHGRLSRRDTYSGYWHKHTTHHLRHKSKC